MSAVCLRLQYSIWCSTYQPCIVQLDLARARIWRCEDFRRVVKDYEQGAGFSVVGPSIALAGD